MDMIGKVIKRKTLTDDDFPLSKGKYAYFLLEHFIKIDSRKTPEEMAVSLLSENTFSTKYAHEICAIPPGGFHHRKFPLFVRTHEAIMDPFREKLAKLANKILELI